MTEQQQHPETAPMKEQVVYAKILQLGAWSGIFILFITYSLYVLGVLGAHVPLEQVPLHWGENVHEFMEATGAPNGWDWLGLLGTGDYLNFVGLALLALMTIVCYFTLIPGYLKRKDFTYAIIAILEIVVLGVAASGILGSGGH